MNRRLLGKRPDILRIDTETHEFLADSLLISVERELTAQERRGRGSSEPLKVVVFYLVLIIMKCS